MARRHPRRLTRSLLGAVVLLAAFGAAEPEPDAAPAATSSAPAVGPFLGDIVR